MIAAPYRLHDSFQTFVAADMATARRFDWMQRDLMTAHPTTNAPKKHVRSARDQRISDTARVGPLPDATNQIFIG